jgi:AraC-like DNA-binding protein
MIFYLSITTLILSLLISYNNYRDNKNSILLAGYMCILSIYNILHFFLFEGNSILGIAILLRHISPLFYIPGLLLFFYVRGTLKNEWSLSKRDLWHFIPMIIGFINIIPYFLIPFEDKIHYAEQLFSASDFNFLTKTTLIYPFYVSAIIRSVLFFSYVTASGVLIWKFHKSTKRKDESTQKQIKWLIFLIGNAILLSICSFCLTFGFYVDAIVEKTAMNNNIFTVIAGLTFSFIPTVLIFFPQVLYGIPHSELMDPNRKDKDRDGLSDKNLYILAARIIEYFENDKPYLDKSFSLDDLANHLDVPKHQLYTCLNTCLNKKFTQLRTSFRIEHAKKLLLSGDLDSKSLQGIWMEAGFSSKTNFFTTFKEETGLTPTEFILLEKNS